MTITVALLYGGVSHERAVSLKSKDAIANALRQTGHRVVEIDATRDLTQTISDLRAAQPDVVFNALYGPLGEDGAIQGVLEWMGLAYTHSNIRASALAMDKDAARSMFRAAGIPIAKGAVVTFDALKRASPFPPPYAVKPISEGSSFGVAIILSEADRERITQEQWEYGANVLIEEYIPGRELTVGVLGGRALTVTEIVSLSKDDTFYNFHAKYAAGGSRHIVPASLPDAIFQQLLSYASLAHKILGCRGATRSDFRYDADAPGGGRLVILELNNQPGLTPTSLLPEQAAHDGMSYAQLCAWIVKDALSSERSVD